MSDSSQLELKETQKQKQKQQSSGSSSSSSPSNSLSLIRLDELSSFGATKQGRLPTLIKMQTSNTQELEATNKGFSMPAQSAEQLEQPKEIQQKSGDSGKRQVSLPAQIETANKENNLVEKEQGSDDEQDLVEDYQMVEMSSADLVGPSLPQTTGQATGTAAAAIAASQKIFSPSTNNLLASNQNLINNHQPPSYLGDSLIEMIINLKNENQSLVKALETNNDYVKNKLDEFKRFNEEAKKREAQFMAEKLEHEHQVRKLTRQNTVLSDRLKSMEAKLKDMKLEVGESLAAAHSSKASSIRDDNNLYPALDTNMDESFGNSALLNQQAQANNQEVTMQMDATSGELYADTDPSTQVPPQAGPSEPIKVGSMTKEELSKRFDADKAEFYAIDDPMKQCDKLEQQLNDIGKRDYEICLLQQQLNIYRQDYRLERMANLEAKLQIEKLKNDIDRFCFERLEAKNRIRQPVSGVEEHQLHRGAHHRRSSGALPAADAVISKIGHHLSRRAAKSAAKAAKYASKQAYREEKATAAAAAAAAAASQQTGTGLGPGIPGTSEAHHRRGHHRHHHSGLRAVRSEVVNDLLSTANKAMLTGYKMASTHVNLAIDKISQFEQAQAANLEKNKAETIAKSTVPSAPPMGTPSLD